MTRLIDSRALVVSSIFLLILASSLSRSASVGGDRDREERGTGEPGNVNGSSAEEAEGRRKEGWCHKAGKRGRREKGREGDEEGGGRASGGKGKWLEPASPLACLPRWSLLRSESCEDWPDAQDPDAALTSAF